MEPSKAEKELFAFIADGEASSTRAKQRLLDMTASGNKLEREFFKFNIPKRASQPEPLEAYLGRVGEFMRVVWRLPAEISRRRDHKSLLEWMNEIDRARDSELREVSRELRAILVAKGVEISEFLLEYLWMISDRKKPEEVEESLREVKAVIGSLGVEEDSVVIKCFLGIVELFRGTERKTEEKCTEEEDGNCPTERDGDELAKLFLMIAKEILRLEVAYGQPELPILLSRSTYYFMANHLKENVFKDTMAALWDKVDEIQTESEQQEIIEFLEETVKFGAREVWKELEYLND